MFEYKIVELIHGMPDIQKAMKEKYDNNFLKYIEGVINEYVENGWNLYAPNIITNPFGSTIRAILIFQKSKK